MKTKNNRLLALLLGSNALLLIPFIAIQITNEVKWGILDFTVMSILLSLTALLSEVVLRNVKTLAARWIWCSLVIIGFLLIWAELAVGIFGTFLAGS